MGPYFAELVAAEVWIPFLVLVRVGAALSLLPFYGDGVISAQPKILMAAFIALAVAPIVRPHIPPQPETVAGLFSLMASEFFVGIFVGSVGRVMMGALDFAGQVISFQIGMSNAQAFNPAMATRGTLIGSMFFMLATFLFLVSDLHHMMLIAVVDSYTLFRPGDALPIGDFADLIAKLVGRSVALGLQLAAPFLTVNILFNVGMGMLARLMPQLQVFFLALPLQLLGGSLLLSIVMGPLLLWFLRGFEDVFVRFLLPS